jgi:PAS domain S-box-containing protein
MNNFKAYKDLYQENQFLKQRIEDVQKQLYRTKSISFLDIIPQMVSYTNKNLEYEYVNKAYERTFGVRDTQIIGKKLVDVIGKEALEKATKHIQKALNGEEVKYLEAFEYPNQPKKYIEGHLIPDITSSNKVEGYWAILHDITDVIEAEKSKRKVASEAAYIERKLQLLKKAEMDLKTIIETHQYTKEHFSSLLTLFRQEIEIDKHWEIFKENFESLHSGFFEKLSSLSSQLTQQDYKHCAYIKMNFETKEIAAMFNIKPSSVQMARVRLKKKMGLSQNHDLIRFIRKL